MPETNAAPANALRLKPDGTPKKAPGPIATETKHVAFSKEWIHRGVRYKPGDEADLLAPEADYLKEMGAVGEKTAGLTPKKDVLKELVSQ